MKSDLAMGLGGPGSAALGVVLLARPASGALAVLRFAAAAPERSATVPPRAGGWFARRSFRYVRFLVSADTREASPRQSRIARIVAGGWIWARILRRTLCISTQAGCPLKCAFCLTG